jgi:deoxyribodipyrimidine photolyase-related protein
VVVLGDQLDLQASGFDGFDPARDAVWMAEVAEESTHVWSAKPGTALFLAAMRHSADDLRARGRPLRYQRLGEGPDTLAEALRAEIGAERPQALVMTAPGDWRVLSALRALAADEGLALEVREDRHFLCSVRDFAAHAKARRSLRMAFFYREMRRRHHVLMDGETPAGGQWNFDADNRDAFGRDGPGRPPAPTRVAPDPITREVIALVDDRFAGHPGALDSFAWPVTRAQALQACFVTERLPMFGRHQDATWVGQPWLWHAQLSTALNLKLLSPRELIDTAEAAWRAGHAPLPGFYWTGDTDMACLRDAIGQTLAHGYAHHIQRLMVTGLYALLLGVEPQQVHRWYLAVYVDAVEWVELPNVLGMSQYADGVTADGRPAPFGPMASKPYVATGQYIARMSNACTGCRYKPAQRTGDDACPFTTLYWDFLLRHEARLAADPRMALQVKNLARLAADERRALAARAAAIRAGGRRRATRGRVKSGRGRKCAGRRGPDRGAARGESRRPRSAQSGLWPLRA